MKLSVTIYSVRDYVSRGILDVPKFVEVVAELGADGVDLGYYWKSCEERREAKRRLEELGLELACYITSNDFAKLRAEERRAEIERVKAAIREAKDMGAEKLRIFAGSLREGMDPKQVEEWVIEALSEVADYALSEGVVLALENHGAYFSKASVIERLLKAVNSPGLKLNFDTGNFVHAGDDPVAAARKLGRWVIHVHAKDIDEKGVPCAPGEGVIDFESIARELEAHGFNGYFSIEYEGARDQLIGVGVGLGYLKALSLRMKLAGSPS
ncbi:MAG: hypothetical protein DRJ96_06455 [Thermoprotei archaeon]|nr:MAG: hypothetical protein DRJ96_06455 [Thermoprotei archaeon]